jgi:endonuclease-3
LSITDIMGLLAGEYGTVRRSRSQEPLPELIMTILSQNTSDHNSRRAFESLVARFGTWEAVAGADVEDIAEAIRLGGLAQVKAPRIKRILEQVLAERGSLDLSFLGTLSVAEARDWLEGLPGVGPKTASCVLLFSLNKPALPVDTHVLRVAKRLGLVGSKATAEKAHELLGALVPAANVYQFHLHMIEHGRRVCKAQHPRCQGCALLPVCPTGRLVVGSAFEHGVKA